MALRPFATLALLIFFLFSGCKSEDLVNEVIDEIEQTTQPGLAGDFIRLINTARAQARTCGNERFPATAPIAWNDLLQEAAGAHSRDMAFNDNFSHSGTNGQNAGARIEKTGYDARTWGENIAAGYPSAGSVVEGWLDSPGHCANIMRSSFTEIGAASAERAGSTYGIYWTLVLAAPR